MTHRAGGVSACAWAHTLVESFPVRLRKVPEDLVHIPLAVDVIRVCRNSASSADRPSSASCRRNALSTHSAIEIPVQENSWLPGGVRPGPESDPPVESVVYNYRDKSIQAKLILPRTTAP